MHPWLPQWGFAAHKLMYFNFCQEPTPHLQDPKKWWDSIQEGKRQGLGIGAKRFLWNHTLLWVERLLCAAWRYHKSHIKGQGLLFTRAMISNISQATDLSAELSAPGCEVYRSNDWILLNPPTQRSWLCRTCDVQATVHTESCRRCWTVLGCSCEWKGVSCFYGYFWCLEIPPLLEGISVKGGEGGKSGWMIEIMLWKNILQVIYVERMEKGWLTEVWSEIWVISFCDQVLFPTL